MFATGVPFVEGKGRELISGGDLKIFSLFIDWHTIIHCHMPESA